MLAGGRYQSERDLLRVTSLPITPHLSRPDRSASSLFGPVFPSINPPFTTSSSISRLLIMIHSSRYNLNTERYIITIAREPYLYTSHPTKCKHVLTFSMLTTAARPLYYTWTGFFRV